VELQGFGFRKRRDGVSSVAGGEEEEASWRLSSHAPEWPEGSGHGGVKPAGGDSSQTRGGR
jgi:hypothetical protein